MRKKRKKSQEKSNNENQDKSLQELLKVKSIENGFYLTEDNRLVAVLKIGTINKDLLSNAEDQELTEEYTAFLKSLYFPYQELMVSQPLDMNEVIQREKIKLKETKDFHRRKMINSYIDFLERLEKSSSIMKRQRYFIFDEKIEKLSLQGLEDSSDILHDRAEEVMLGFKDIKLKTELITGLEGARLLQIFYDFESAQNAPIQSIDVPEIIVGGKDNVILEEDQKAEAN